MALISYLSFRKIRVKEMRHLTHFWLSFFVLILISYLVRDENNYLVALSLLGWLWPLWTIHLLLEDTTGQGTLGRRQYIILGLASFVTLALAGYRYSFLVVAIPFSFVVGILGLYSLNQVFQKTKSTSTILHRMIIFTFGVFFTSRIIFPFIRGNENLAPWFFVLNLLIISLLAPATLSLYLLVINQQHDKKLEELVNERNQQLFTQSKYAELGMMSAGVAHEINNPLAIIQAKVTQLLRSAKDPSKRDEIIQGLEQILFTSERINRTIQGVREFVHQDERESSEEITVKQLIDDVLAFCGQRMKNHGISLRFYHIDNLCLRGHKIQLEQVILNLFNNSFDAIEFLPDKWIELSGQETMDSIKLFVKDSGHGIPNDVADRIMEPFFTTKKSGRGTGLGLALAKGIIEKHGGKLIYLKNSPHTTFLIELPKNPPIYSGRRESLLPLLH